MRKKVYIAGPMTLGNKAQNFADAMNAYEKLCKLGYAPLMPQLSFFTEPFMTLTHEEWLDIDLPWVSSSDCLLRLPGASVGADKEVELAHELSIPVYYNVEDLVSLQ